MRIYLDHAATTPLTPATAKAMKPWITDRFGRKVYPREWFYVLPEHVSRAVQAIKDGTLHQIEYDPETQSIRKKT